MRARLIAVAFLLLFSLPLFAAITGTVMNVDGQPIAGAKVSLFAPETMGAQRARLLSASPERTPVATVQTDSRGAFKLDSPPDPVVQLRIEAKGYAPELLGAERDDDLGAIALVAAESRSGKITANGKPVAGATVIWLTGRSEAIAKTDAQGQYSVPDPSKWASRVLIVHPDYALFDETSVRPLGGNAKKSLDHALDAGVAVSGRVVGPDGQTPAAKATVLLDGWPVATSGDDGTFSIAHAPKKWELLEARSGNLAGQRAQAGGGAVAVKLAKGATVAGSLRDAKSGVPVAGGEVLIGRAGAFFLASTPVASALVDAKGNYTIGPLAPGTYTVTPFRSGYSITPANVSLAAGQTAQKPFTVIQEAKVSGMVVDEDKKPLGAAVVSPQTVSREPGMFMAPRFLRGGGRTVFSGPDGRFSLRIDPDSDVQIEAVKKGLPAAKSSALRLGAGERKSGVTITVPRGIAVSGRVVDKNGKPLSGVAVVANESEGGGGMGGMIRRQMAFGGGFTQRDDTTMRTGSDGTFTIRLKEGTYDLNFKREGYAPKTVRAQQVNAAAKPVEVTLEEGVEIAGRVTRGGAGVADANIGVMSPDQQSFETTGPDGSFRIADLQPGPMMLMINKQSDFIQQTRPVTAPAHDVQIELPAGGSIHGRAVDKTTHQPVTAFQAGISTSRQGGGMMIMAPPQLRSFTTDDGTFTLENVPAGPVEVIVQAPGYTTGRVAGLTLEEGKSLNDVEVGLDTGVKLNGRVTGPDGAPLSGASVRQDTTGGRMRTVRIGGPDAAVVTDANGEYTIEAVEPGEKTFEFTRAGYLSESRTVTLSGRDARLDVQLSSGMRLTGVVTTEGGVPVADASVRALSAASGGFGRSTQTDAGGGFQFEGLAPGHYTFSASKNGYADGSVRDVDISSGAPVRITLKTGGVIYGHVTGLTDSELAHASVEARGAAGSASAPVDSTGNYRIEGAPTGTVRVQAEVSRGFGENRTAPIKSAQLDSGGTAQVDLEFLSQTTIRGRVTRDGKPLGNAMVAFFPRNAQSQTNSQTTTDESGNYTINGLQDAQYTVNVVDLQRLNPYSTTYTVKGSSTFDIDIRTTTLRGRVLDAATGEPLAEARIQLRKSGSGESPFSTRGATTNSSGAFTLESVTPGSYVVTADKDGYGNDVRDVVVTDTASDDVELKLASNSGINLKVVDARDGRTLSANATVYDAQNRVVYDEPFRFGGGADTIHLTLSPGSYRAVISAMGYATRSVSLTSPSNQTVPMTPGGTIVVRLGGGESQRARLVDSTGQPYVRPMSRNAVFMLDSPGTTTLPNVAPGTYTLQLLDPNDAPVKSQSVVVVEGGTATVDI